MYLSVKSLPIVLTKCFCLCLVRNTCLAAPRRNSPGPLCLSCCFAPDRASLDQPLLCAGPLLSVLSAEEPEEALLYCVGALKFLSGNGAILRLLLDNNCMSVAQKLIGRLCGAGGACSTMAGHILVQVRRRGSGLVRSNLKDQNQNELFCLFLVQHEKTLSSLCSPPNLTQYYHIIFLLLTRPPLLLELNVPLPPLLDSI